MSTNPRVIVVGAGVGGLSAAIVLASQGAHVDVLEGASGPGGKLAPLQVGGAQLDCGPTVFTMRWVFDELYALADQHFDRHVSLQAARTLARHAWSADERLDLQADVEASVDAIGDFAGADEGLRYRAFCARSARVYGALESTYLKTSRPAGPVDLARRFGLRRLPQLVGISPFGSLWHALGRELRDPRLRQLFGRYATYCGSSPFHAPATLMLVAHVEQQGVWLVDGGMHRLAVSLADLAVGQGATLRYGAPVSEITVRGGRATGVRLRSGEQLTADAVVFNGDCAALAAGLLGPDVRRAAGAPAQRSLSAVTWNLVARAEGFPLLRHNVFFSSDYRAEFDSLFRDRQLPAQPTVYVCGHDRHADDGAEARPGPERLMCLVNAPATGDLRPDDAMALQACEQATFGLLRRCGLDVDLASASCVRLTPQDFAQRFPGTGGALYGAASHGWRASFTRPGARSQVAGLYLAGGSTHPGPGVPMAALSGRQAAASLLGDWTAAARRAA